MMDREYTTLNKCPICGSTVAVWYCGSAEDREYIIECDNDCCGLSYGRSCGYDYDGIKEVWNIVTAPKESEDE